jgi:hypothetical protein
MHIIRPIIHIPHHTETDPTAEMYSSAYRTSCTDFFECINERIDAREHAAAQRLLRFVHKLYPDNEFIREQIIFTAERREVSGNMGGGSGGRCSAGKWGEFAQSGNDGRHFSENDIHIFFGIVAAKGEPEGTMSVCKGNAHGAEHV